MRILVDECVDPRVKSLFPGHDVSTVYDMGWDQLTEGPLLARANESFDVLLTIDKSLEFQQNLKKLFSVTNMRFRIDPRPLFLSHLKPSSQTDLRPRESMSQAPTPLATAPTQRPPQIPALARIEALLAALVQMLDSVQLGRRRCLLLITVSAASLALITRFPHYEALSQLPNDVENQAMSWQIQHPLTPIPAHLKDIGLNGGPASHVDKMEMRLTLPLLGRLSRTGKWTVVVWSPIATLILFYLAAWCAFDSTGDMTTTALFVAGLGATFFGSWGFNDFIFGDSVALALTLLCACCLRYPWISGLSFLGAAFCDERSVTAAPLLLLYFVVRRSQPAEKAQRNRLVLATLSAIVTWIVARSWLSATFHLSAGTSLLATWDIFRGHMTRGWTLLSFVGIFRVFWIIPALAVRRLFLENDTLLVTAFLAACVVAIAPAFLVLDLNRSICYSFMMFFVSLRVLWRHANPPGKTNLAAMTIINIGVSAPPRTILRFLA